MNEFGLAEKREFWKFLSLLFITVLADYATMQADAIIGGKFFGPDVIAAEQVRPFWAGSSPEGKM